MNNLRVKNSEAAFNDLTAKITENSRVIIEGSIRARISFIGEDEVIHNRQEELQFSHLIDLNYLPLSRRGNTIQLDKEACRIEYSFCRYNKHTRQMELALILFFSLMIYSNGVNIHAREERTLITAPVLETPDCERDVIELVEVPSLETLLNEMLVERIQSMEKGLLDKLRKDSQYRIKEILETEMADALQSSDGVAKGNIFKSLIETILAEQEKNWEDKLSKLKREIRTAVRSRREEERIISDKKRINKLKEKSILQQQNGYSTRESDG